jgi:lipoyl(octanoyl) transferase
MAKLLAGPAIARQCLRNADYEKTLLAMRAFTQSRHADTPDCLWQVEHLPVFTLGQAGLDTHVLDPGDIAVIKTERGGQVTYHGPGQVVVYTLVDIRRRGLGVKETVCRLEQALINTLTDFGVLGATRKPKAPGVYVPFENELAKIAALGLKVVRGAAYHGVALNVSMDLAPFSRINPCGFPGLVTVDMARMGVHAKWQDVANQLCDHIQTQLANEIKNSGTHNNGLRN